MSRFPWTCCILVAALSATPTSALARGKDDAPAQEATAEERAEIRRLATRVGRGRHPSLRSEAANALGRYGPKAEAAVPALTAALKDRDVNVRTTAAIALGKVGARSAPAVKALTQALGRERDVELQAAAAEALGMIGDKAAPAASALVAALGSESGDVRREAAGALGFLGPKAEKVAVRPLRERLTDAEPRVQLAAAMSLTRLGAVSEELTGILARAVPKASRLPVEQRQAACEALGLVGAQARGAVKPLIEVLREEADINSALPYVEQRQAQHDALRRAAAGALGAIGDREAIPALQRAARVEALREAASAALAQLGAEEE